MTMTTLTRTAMARTTITSISLAAAVALSSNASAQDFMPDLPDVGVLSDVEARNLPPELRVAPRASNRIDSQEIQPFSETTIGPDGVETITRTRRITRRAPAVPATTRYVPEESYQAQRPVLPNSGVHYSHGYAPSAQVFQREQGIAECERRTDGHRGRKKGGIIGGLLGAVAGGIIGNRAFDSERLGGTLLGVGVGGLGGALLGSLIGGGRNDRGEYDCEAALDAYLSQYVHGGHRVAARSIPAPAPVYAQPTPVYAVPAYTYAAPQYYYQPPQQITYVPIEYQQRQRVIVRETVREEVIPGARRTIPAPRPAPEPRPIKGPSKARPVYIKGN